MRDVAAAAAEGEREREKIFQSNVLTALTALTAL
jgi:hypothetical protein